MKKIFAMLLSACMLSCLAACGEEEGINGQWVEKSTETEPISYSFYEDGSYSQTVGEGERSTGTYELSDDTLKLHNEVLKMDYEYKISMEEDSITLRDVNLSFVRTFDRADS